MRKSNTAVQQSPAVQQPGIVAPATPISPVLIAAQQVQVASHSPVVAPQQKQVRYGALALLANPNATIAWVQANPHAQGTKTFAKHNLFKVGQTITQVRQAFVEAGYPVGKANNQLRWALAHNQITLAQ